MRALPTLAVSVILALCSCNGRSQQVSYADGNDLEFKHIEFGFNTTYLASSPKFEPALEKISEDGFRKVRIYEPFTKKLMSEPDLGWNHLEWLKKNEFEVLLSMSNFPYKNKARPSQLEKLPEKQRSFPKKAINYSNRYPPGNTVGYRESLDAFLMELDQRKLLDNMQFEIGNEPNAPRYFWGDAEDWKTVRSVMNDALQTHGKTALCCGYTSSMFLQPTKQRHGQFISDWKRKVKDNYQTSFHVYLNTGSGAADLENPELDVTNGVITEYGMFSHFTEEKATRKASPEYVLGLAKLLAFTYENDISEVYLFPLMDDGEKKARMGYFDIDGNPKESYLFFKAVWNVVKDGYSVEKDDRAINVIGHEQILTVAIEDISAHKNWQIHSSFRLELGKINSDGWIIRAR